MSKRTISEAELRTLVAQGKTHSQIANMIGRHPAAVAAACYILGVSSKVKTKKTPEAALTFLNDLKAGNSINGIAAKHGIGYAAVYHTLRRAGLPTSARKLLQAEAAKQAA
jgi:hypothetical protein